ncbi:MAG: hypothetical protein SF069_06890 [Phycisphaerae bacterium]|nr:hypothetical protein [Phycisphaerae bacterium]
MNKNQTRKLALLIVTGSMLFQLSGCLALAVNQLGQQILGTLIGTVITNIVRGVAGTDGTTA